MDRLHDDPAAVPMTAGLLSEEGLSTPKWLFLHVIDTVGVVHAIILRIQALLLPVQTLVLSGGH